jgi:predicted TIM-barrel fold metal-dependent hydrolase
MDEMGVWAQIVYPNTAGFGANKLVKIEDRSLGLLVAETYNSAVAELQDESGQRLFPMALMPFWDVEAAAKEVRRACGDLGLRGVAMCSEPQAAGLPSLLAREWDPLWEACEETGAVINFHVGASEFSMDAFRTGTWDHDEYLRRYVVGCSLLELHNSRILANLLVSDLLDRHPDLKWVSVESGIGWIPYILERLEYQLLESRADGTVITSPTQQFRDHVYACFWFEETAPGRNLDRIGFDNVLFESDFPHPTCLYPDPVQRAVEVLSPWGPEVIRKVMGGNAIELYRLPA